MPLLVTVQIFGEQNGECVSKSINQYFLRCLYFLLKYFTSNKHFSHQTLSMKNMNPNIETNFLKVN